MTVKMRKKLLTAGLICGFALMIIALVISEPGSRPLTAGLIGAFLTVVGFIGLAD